MSTPELLDHRAQALGDGVATAVQEEAQRLQVFVPYRPRSWYPSQNLGDLVALHPFQILSRGTHCVRCKPVLIASQRVRLIHACPELFGRPFWTAWEVVAVVVAEHPVVVVGRVQPLVVTPPTPIVQRVNIRMALRVVVVGAMLGTRSRKAHLERQVIHG